MGRKKIKYSSRENAKKARQELKEILQICDQYSNSVQNVSIFSMLLFDHMHVFSATEADRTDSSRHQKIVEDILDLSAYRNATMQTMLSVAALRKKIESIKLSEETIDKITEIMIDVITPAIESCDQQIKNLPSILLPLWERNEEALTKGLHPRLVEELCIFLGVKTERQTDPETAAIEQEQEQIFSTAVTESVTPSMEAVSE